jgi:hypothetical protein
MKIPAQVSKAIKNVNEYLQSRGLKCDTWNGAMPPVPPNIIIQPLKPYYTVQLNTSDDQGTTLRGLRSMIKMGFDKSPATDCLYTKHTPAGTVQVWYSKTRPGVISIGVQIEDKTPESVRFWTAIKLLPVWKDSKPSIKQRESVTVFERACEEFRVGYGSDLLAVALKYLIVKDTTAIRKIADTENQFNEEAGEAPSTPVRCAQALLQGVFAYIG